MRSYAAVVRSELLGGGRLLLAAAALGLLAWLAAWLPQAQGFEATEVRGSAALLASGVLALGAVLFLGPGLVTRQLSEGRLGFYFARPVSGAALWWGKLTAAAGLVATAVVLVWLPALLSGVRPAATLADVLGWPETSRQASSTRYELVTAQPFVRPMDGHVLDGHVLEERSLGSPLLWAAFLLFVLLLLAHTVSLVLSSKSPWVAFDLLAAATVVYGGWRIADQLLSNRAEGALLTAFLVATAGLFLGLLAAGHAAVDVGRTFHRRVHAAASVVLWGVLLAALLGIGAASRRLLASEVEDLRKVSYFVTAPRGDWLLAGGSVGDSGYAPLFAVHSATGRQKKVDILPRVSLPPTFSADGGSVAWTSCHGVRCRVLWLDLRDPELRTVGFDFEGRAPEEYLQPAALALSHDGRRLAFLRDGTLVVQAMPSLDVLASAELWGGDTVAWWPQLTFRDDDTVRLTSRRFEPPELSVLELEVSARRLRSLPGGSSRPESSGKRLVFRTVHLAAPAKNRFAAEWWDKNRRRPGDRNVVLEIPEEGNARLKYFDATGAERWSRELEGRDVSFGRETSQGVWLGLKEPFETLEIALDDGRILARYPGFLPATPMSKILVDRTGMPHRRGPDGELTSLIELRRRH